MTAVIDVTEATISELVARSIDASEARIAQAVGEALRIFADRPAGEKGAATLAFGVVDTPFSSYAQVLLDGDTTLTSISSLGTAPDAGTRVAVLFVPPSGALILGPSAPSAGGGGSTPTAYFAGAVTLAATGAGAYEHGDTTVTSVPLTATIVDGSVLPTALRFYRDSTLLHTVIDPSLSESFTDPTPVTNTTVYTVQLDDAVGPTVTSNEARFDFVYPYYYGLSATDALGAGVALLSKDIAVESTRTEIYTLTGTPQYVYFALPAAYAPVVVVRDRLTGVEFFPSGFKAVATATITGLDGSPQSYKVYQSTNLQGLASGPVYNLDFSSSADVTRGGSDLITAAQLPAVPLSGLLIGLDTQTQIYELANKTGPYARLYSMSSVFEEWDYFGGGRTDAGSPDHSGLIGTLGWLTQLDASGDVSNPTGVDGDSLGYVNPQVTLSASTTDCACIFRNIKEMQAAPAFTNAWRMSLEILNDGTNDYKVRFGLHDSTNPITPSNGFWFTYTDASANWHFKTANAATASDTDTGIVADVNYHWFVIQCDGSGDAPVVRAYIVDDIVDWVPGVTTPVATVSDGTMIPGIGDIYGPSFVLSKQSGSALRGVRLSRYYLRVGHD